jgi:ABC-type antimicrobial peptide transport system permease subunit
MKHDIIERKYTKESIMSEHADNTSGINEDITLMAYEDKLVSSVRRLQMVPLIFLTLYPILAVGFLLFSGKSFSQIHSMWLYAGLLMAGVVLTLYVASRRRYTIDWKKMQDKYHVTLLSADNQQYDSDDEDYYPDTRGSLIHHRSIIRDVVYVANGTKHHGAVLIDKDLYAILVDEHMKEQGASSDGDK